MGRKEDNIKKAIKLMINKDKIRNIGIAAHIDHGKTTLSDNLIAGAGMMSEELAGKLLVLDYDEQEQARGITINSASVSMVHDYEGGEYLINLIDTPGHVDFGGDVTRALRAVDGVIIVTCAVEGVMPQTETVIRQAMKEKVKPILFINKVDRLIAELQLGPEEMQERFGKIISKVNKIIKTYAPKDVDSDWTVKVEDGTVAFGSAYHNWATSIPFLKKSNISFKEIYDYLANDDRKELAKKSPLHEVLLDMVITNLVNPEVAQKYRIPKIWKGDLDSDIGKGMLSCDSKSPVSLMITKIIIDPNAGEIAFGRLFGGKLKKSQELYITGQGNKKYRIQQLSMMVGADRINVEEIYSGNIAAMIGLKDAIAGSTVSNLPDIEPFEQMKHYSDPVVTVAIEAKHTKDLPKLIDVLRSIAKADPSIQIEINQETGEHLMSGMGELHLEITLYRMRNEHKVEVNASEPIIVYRETADHKGGPFEGKSPNKHNKFYIEVEPLGEDIVKAILDGEFPEGLRLKNKKDIARKLQEFGMDKKEAKGIEAIIGTNIFLDATKGIQYLNETIELVKQAFQETVKRGPLANENVYGVKIRLEDAKLHEDSIHRGPGQIIPAARNGIYGALCQAERVLLEPMQKVFVNVPQKVMGAVTSEMTQRRGEILEMVQEGEDVNVISKVPIAKMFGFASNIRSVTSGRVLWSTENIGYEILPREFLDGIVKEIRERKGLKPEPYDENYYAST